MAHQPKPTLTDNELIAIAHCYRKAYSDEEIAEAEKELEKRGISEEEQWARLDTWDKEKEAVKKVRKHILRKDEGYTIFRMALILLTAPFVIFSSPLFGMPLSQLKEEGYERKYKQRLILIAVGSLLWGMAIIARVNMLEYERLQEIKSIDLTEWEKTYYPKDSTVH